MCSINVIRHSLVPVYGTLEINLLAGVWVIVSSTSCCVHTLFSLTQPPQSSQLSSYVPLSICIACPQLLCFPLHSLQWQSWKRTECFRWGCASGYIKEFIDFSAIFWLSWIFCLLLFFLTTARHWAKYLQQRTFKWNWKRGRVITQQYNSDHSFACEVPSLRQHCTLAACSRHSLPIHSAGCLIALLLSWPIPPPSLVPHAQQESSRSPLSAVWAVCWQPPSSAGWKSLISSQRSVKSPNHEVFSYWRLKVTCSPLTAPPSFLLRGHCHDIHL